MTLRRVRLVLFALVLCGVWSPAQAAIGTDATTTATPVASSTTITWNHTCQAGSVIVVRSAWGQGNQSATATYDGEAMTELYDTPDSLPQNRAGAWILAAGANCDNTSNPVVITYSSAVDLAGANASSYTGVDTATPNRAVFTASGQTTGATVTVTNAQSGDWVLDTAAVLATTLTPDASQTIEWEDDAIAGGGTSGWASRETATGSTVMSGSHGNAFWTIGAFALIPAGGAAAPRPSTLPLTGVGR